MPRVIYEIEERENFLIGFIGHNRTGKTTMARELAKTWRQYNDGPVMAFDPQNKFKDIADFFILSSDENKDEQILNLRNGLLILDDYKVLHPGVKAETWIQDLMQFRNAYNVDIIYITHNPSLVINLLTYYTTKYYIFYTEVLQGSWGKKIPNYDMCINASNFINKYVKITGTKGSYPNFPYVIVDNQNEKLSAVNMDSNIINKKINKRRI